MDISVYHELGAEKRPTAHGQKKLRYLVVKKLAFPNPNL